jgi:outer membrane immunogenic protein
MKLGGETRRKMKRIARILAAPWPLLLAALGGISLARPGPLLAQEARPFELGANYNYIHSNAPPGLCGCFALKGASVWGAYGLTSRFSLVGDFAVQHSVHAGASGEDLTLLSYTAGTRYLLAKRGRLRMFGEAMVGGAHAGGSLAPGGSAGFPGSPDSVAFLAGGGVDVRIAKRWSVRALEADYYLTHFANGANNHQNNLRLGFGLFFLLSKQ